MLKKCNRILAFLLALVLVITTFKSDFNGLRVFASEEDEITVDATGAEAAEDSEETELPSIFEKVDEVPVVIEDAEVTDSENQNEQVEEIVEENKEDENQEEVTEEVAEEEAEESEEQADEDDLDKAPVSEKRVIPFFGEAYFDGLHIILNAEPEVLPDDAELKIEKVPSYKEEKIANTIDGELGEQLNVVATYSYDINIYSESVGDFVQPENGKVEVVFESVDDAASSDTKLAVFHVEDSLDNANKVADASSDTATEVSFDAGHFSIYTVTIYGYGSDNTYKEFNAGVYDLDGNAIDKENNIRKVKISEKVERNEFIDAASVAPEFDGYVFDHATYNNVNIVSFSHDYTKALAVLENDNTVILSSDDVEAVKFFYAATESTEYLTTSHIDLGFTENDMPKVVSANVIINGVSYPLENETEESDLDVKELRLTLPAKTEDGELTSVSDSDEITFEVVANEGTDEEPDLKTYTHKTTQDEVKNAYERCLNAHAYKENECGFDFVFDFTAYIENSAEIVYHRNLHLWYEIVSGMPIVFDSDPFKVTWKAEDEKQTGTYNVLNFANTGLTINTDWNFVFSGWGIKQEDGSIVLTYIYDGVSGTFSPSKVEVANGERVDLYAVWQYMDFSDGRTRLHYFVLGKENNLDDPNPGPQKVRDYYPSEDLPGGKYIWNGTAVSIDNIDDKYISYQETENYYKSVYDWENGFDNSIVQHKYDDGAVEKINAYLKDEYGKDFDESDILWYVYKRHQTDGMHIDGYVTSYITYHANLLPTEVGDDKLIYVDKKVRYGTNKKILDNMFKAKNNAYKFLGWSKNPNAIKPDAGLDADSLKLEGDLTPTVHLDSKVHLYAIWDRGTPYKLKITIKADAQGDDLDKTLVYDGEKHNGGIVVTIDADIHTEEANGLEKIKKAISGIVEGFRELQVPIVQAAEYAPVITPVTGEDIPLGDMTIHVDGIKEIAQTGVDVGTYDVSLNYDDMTITTKIDGKDVNIKDMFVVEVTTENAKGEKTVTEVNIKDDTEKAEEVVAHLNIIKRNVVLSSLSATKQYDGTPLTNYNVTVGGDGFANGKERGQEGATFNVTGSQTEVGNSPNTFTYTLKPENTFAGNYNITTNVGTLTVTPVGNDNPPPDDNPPTITPPGQVLGAVRPVDGAAVLGARRGRTEDSANTLGRIITIIVAAGIGFTMIFIKRKKNEE